MLWVVLTFYVDEILEKPELEILEILAWCMLMGFGRRLSDHSIDTPIATLICIPKSITMIRRAEINMHHNVAMIRHLGDVMYLHPSGGQMAIKIKDKLWNGQSCSFKDLRIVLYRSGLPYGWRRTATHYTEDGMGKNNFAVPQEAVVTLAHDTVED
jgi:hypothetical protein